jgi:radical SAM/SPASM domain FxsB family protein
MDPFEPQIRFSSALLKVASRCNLNCDYCYVYQHADQSWRTQPAFMSDDTVDAFARRLDEYVRRRDIPDFSVTFHGGEPLLAGAERLVAIASRIRAGVTSSCDVDFSLQTNATLVDKDVVARLEEAGILVSLSLDGPRSANDRHRLDHAGRTSFEAVVSALALLKGRPIFQGVIAVIDPAVPPRELFEFFAELNLPRLDLLLPDATHERRPQGRDAEPDLYYHWLQEAFKLWFEEFSSIPIRWFDALLASRAGIPSPTDAMGLGALSLLVIDTDGSYTDHDVFKITRLGPSLGVHLSDITFDALAEHPSLRAHAHRLTLEGLAEECRRCPVVEACGGGSVMHRWHPQRGLDAPTVYCRELTGLFELATRLLTSSLPPLGRLLQQVPLSGAALETASRSYAAPADGASGDDREPPGAAERLNPVAIWRDSVRVHAVTPELARTLADNVRVLPRDSVTVQHGVVLLEKAEAMLRTLDPYLPSAFGALISDIIFVESSVENDDKILSFSDEGVPNVLYVSPSVGRHLLGADDFADSLYHEFLHHVLYHFERSAPLLHDRVFPRFPSPWRAGLRPSGAFLHGAFVFTNLARYWDALDLAGPPTIDSDKARANANRFRGQASYGIDALRRFALLTAQGNELLDQLDRELLVLDRAYIARSAIA